MARSISKKTQIRSLIKDLESSVHILPLATTPKDIVPGEGNLDAKILLIGEAPGHNEQVQRRPFVGRSGQLLRKSLAEVGRDPATVYITNIVKARPPENRDPTPEEIQAYKPFLDREIEIIDPKLIVTLGRFSMAKFLFDVKISQVHGRLHKVKWQGKTTYILPMYHPAAALRATRVKLAFIEDFKKIDKILPWMEKQQEVQGLEDNIKDAVF